MTGKIKALVNLLNRKQTNDPYVVMSQNLHTNQSGWSIAYTSF